MLFNTPQFVLFFILVFLFYYFPVIARIRRLFLVMISLYFCYSIGGYTTLASLVFVIILTFFGGILIEKHRNKFILGLLVIIDVVLLLFSKYYGFFGNLILNQSQNLSSVMTMIGISYYIFSSISYLVDIYKGKDKCEYDILNLTCWLAFFPKFIAGPIVRYRDFRNNFSIIENSYDSYQNIKRGLLIASYGYFQKIIIADRIGIIVDNVYQNLSLHSGITLIIVTLLYSLQIYFDFCGYSQIALGISYSLGINISKNFNHPYFAVSISDFWDRWHISLSDWLKEYIYIPLGGNRKGMVRKQINILITFLISGLWHGTGLNYIIWGGIHGIYQVGENILKAKKIKSVLNIQSRVLTFLVVSITWIFFRSESATIAFDYIKRMFITFNPWILSDGTLLNLGLDIYEWIVLGIGVLIAFTIEKRQMSGISLYKTVCEQNIIIRWTIYILIIFTLLIFGVYGPAYDSSKFIYFKY